ncbi:hypothetical protein [Pseudomonas sp. MBLB4136]|uniref:hypothetical protein n=1 Tax=Pseudomonas sp. MBLB4136 TaxID=3451558 RepID=UPI003F755DA3
MAFRAKKRISERNAYNMILALAFHGNHYNDIHGQIRAVSDVKAHYAQNGRDFARVVAHCRDFSQSVPIYENLIGAQWTAEGVTVSRPNHITGEYESVVSGDGVYNESDYWATFEISKEDFDSAIQTGRWERFLAAVNAGIAAVEAFLNHQYMTRLRASGDNVALRENIETKMKTWPAKLTGSAFDLSGRSWASFSKLKKLRDDGFQHRKAITTGISRKQHLELLNEYKQAVPRLLFDLHVHFDVRCPSAIIRYAYYPEIEMESRAHA